MTKDRDIDRIHSKEMEYYRYVYKDSPRWDGEEPLNNRKLIVYCEQGFGDIIQFLRYIPALTKDAQVMLHIPKALHRLVHEQSWGVELLDKEDVNLPEHDLHVLSMSLPFFAETLIPHEPYLKVKTGKELPDGEMKIGICWEGNPEHVNANIRHCPLKWFRELEEMGTLYKLQIQIHDKNLLEGCENLELYGVEIKDFLDTAELIESLDLVISVDTAVLHLAGAMGKKAYGLLSIMPDGRWGFTGTQSRWYPSIKLFRQTKPLEWRSLFSDIKGE